jgi:hypothetical protein
MLEAALIACCVPAPTILYGLAAVPRPLAADLAVFIQFWDLVPGRAVEGLQRRVVLQGLPERPSGSADGTDCPAVGGSPVRYPPRLEAAAATAWTVAHSFDATGATTYMMPLRITPVGATARGRTHAESTRGAESM